MAPDGPPVVSELNSTDLSIRQPLRGGGTFSIVCCETNVTFTGVDEQGKTLHWACDMVGGAQQNSVVQTVTSNNIVYHATGMKYQLSVPPDTGSCQQLGNGAIRLSPNSSGTLVLLPGASM
jgi:hypothetical protein